MSIKKLSYINLRFVSKKVLSLALMFTMISLFAAGCGQKNGSIGTKATSTPKESSQKVQLPQNNTDSTQDKNKGENAPTSSGNSAASTTSKSSNATTAKSSDTSAATNTKLQEVSAQMDKLGSTLDGLDNSSEISTTESIINNIN